MASSDAIGAEEMAIDGAVSQTAAKAWDKRWATSKGRADWLEPHPELAILPELLARRQAGARSRVRRRLLRGSDYPHVEPAFPGAGMLLRRC